MISIKEVIAQSAEALRESAKSHKRAAQFHRQATRNCMESLAKLRETCAALNIQLIIQPKGEGENTHGQKTSRSIHRD